MMKKMAMGLVGVFAIFLGVLYGGGVPKAFAESETLFGADYENAIPKETRTETIYYAQKSDSASSIETMVPRYNDGSGKTQMCAVLAGASAIGYFDLTYGNLIPNFEPARVIAGKTIFKNTGAEIQTLISDLYDAMGTQESGTTYNGFKQGMGAYVQEHGYTLELEEFGSNHAGVREWIDNDKPVALFLLNEFHMIGDGSIQDNGTYDQYLVQYFSGNHVVLAFGYRTITYYNADGTVKENHRLYRVFTGLFDMPYGYVDLERTVTIDQMAGLGIV